MALIKKVERGDRVKVGDVIVEALDWSPRRDSVALLAWYGSRDVERISVNTLNFYDLTAREIVAAPMLVADACAVGARNPTATTAELIFEAPEHIKISDL